MSIRYKSTFFKDERLPFVETRYVTNSNLYYHEHFHDTLSIGAVENGEVTYRCQAKNYLLRPNKLALLNPQVVHACNPLDNRPRTYHMTYICPKWCKELQESIFGKLKTFIPLNQIEIENSEIFTDYIKLNHLLLDTTVSLLEKEENLQEFLINLFSRYCNKEPLSQLFNDDCIEAIYRAKEYINNNFHKNLTIKQISAYATLSPFYFIRAFKKKTHLTPHAYLLNKKITIAKQLLSQGMDISQVALEVGFFDQSHFHKIFKQYVATTPHEYKSSILKSKKVNTKAQML